MSEKKEKIPNEALVNVFASSNFDAESEADIIYGLLTSSGIDAVIMRQNVQELPAGVVEVRVLESKLQEARQLIQDSIVEPDEGSSE